MYRYSQGMSGNNNSVWTRKSKQILAAALIIFMAATIVLSVFVVRNSVFEKNTDRQLSQRMLNCASASVEQVSKMPSGINSGTLTRLGVVRQYVYTMEQLNEISIALHGEGGRLAPDEAFTAIYSDIANFEAIAQTATSSTLDARTLLLTHLKNLQLVLFESQKE